MWRLVTKLFEKHEAITGSQNSTNTGNLPKEGPRMSRTQSCVERLNMCTDTAKRTCNTRTFLYKKQSPFIKNLYFCSPLQIINVHAYYHEMERPIKQ